MDYTRLTQNGNWQGWIEFRGRKITVTPELWLGTRDRSWGIRPVGAADTQPEPSRSGYQSILLVVGAN